MGEKILNLLYESDQGFGKSHFLNLFWVGFGLYTLGFMLTTMANPIYIICDLLRLVGIVLFVPSAISIINIRFKNRYLKVVYTLYCLWLLTVVIRGLEVDYEFVKNKLFNPFQGIFKVLSTGCASHGEIGFATSFTPEFTSEFAYIRSCLMTCVNCFL